MANSPRKPANIPPAPPPRGLSTHGAPWPNMSPETHYNPPPVGFEVRVHSDHISMRPSSPEGLAKLVKIYIVPLMLTLTGAAIANAFVMWRDQAMMNAHIHQLSKELIDERGARLALESTVANLRVEVGKNSSERERSNK